MRVLLSDRHRPLFTRENKDSFETGAWPAQWVMVPGVTGRSFVWACRRSFVCESATTIRMHVSADQRYELWLDGRRIGRGPERGDALQWHYETYDVSLEAGGHAIVARVWTLDPMSYAAPGAQLTVRPGFLLAAQKPWDQTLNTGVALWEAKVIDGYVIEPTQTPTAASYAGGTLQIDGRLYPWGVERGEGDGWVGVEDAGRARDVIDQWGEIRAPRLEAAALPAMLDEHWRRGIVRHVDQRAGVAVDESLHLIDDASAWSRLWRGEGSLTLASGTQRRVIVDFEDYVCGYAQLTLSGGHGASVRITWAEALFEGDVHANRKGRRDQIAGKTYDGRGDTFTADGGERRTFSPLWWSSGRYIEVDVRVADEPLIIESLSVRETRYPLPDAPELNVSDVRFNTAVPIMWRTLQMCSHETYMDCPYYEQLMYTGDTRLEALVTYVAADDDLLPRKAIRMFGQSLTPLGLTQARYPSRVPQVIPQFSLFWVAMLHDFALWRGDRAFLVPWLPTARCVIETFLSCVGGDGLIRWPQGWNWVDWVPAWHHGSPPDDGSRLSGINQAQLIYVLGLMSELERWFDEHALADRLDARRRLLIDAMSSTFWDDARGLFADTPDHSSFSEHAQCYMVLSGSLGDGQLQRVVESLLTAPDLHRATIYFQHYLFEVCRQARRPEAMLQRMTLWYDLPNQGLKTALEMPEPSRSDCHAWSSHPIFHGLASILGVRPAALGFPAVTISPLLGPLTHARGRVATPQGPIVADLHRRGSRVVGQIILPANLAGTLVLNGEESSLGPGRQTVG